MINLAGLAGILKIKNVPKMDAEANPKSEKVEDLSLDFALDDLFNEPAEVDKNKDPIKINPGSF